MRGYRLSLNERDNIALNCFNIESANFSSEMHQFSANHKSAHWELKLVFTCLIKDTPSILPLPKNKICGRIILNIHINTTNSDFLTVTIAHHSTANID